ncbi:SDR family oxidoreductase [Curtobacterium sp. MCBA15_008]|uniref:SDR family oxidoreductase n=1 Tax=Curtobacterium sp. MCBA15_008 TaxID=1898736 RepID=UPI0008DDAE8D|nr:SDR family oxidoreductase [Curtobacterium sp. MCBA15_008]OII13706.1 NAD(P)-dependent oxidoreductase [Curtobacterium sp. MCBA15_008]
MIVITGATGALGGLTTDHLLEHLAPHELAVVARDPAKAERFAARGVEVRHGDYAEPATLPAAFAGADQLLLVSSSDPSADAVALHRAAVDAAVSAGVGRVLYTSHQGAAHGSPFGPGADHAATEDLLHDSGLPWTSLRNGFYAHSSAWLMGPWQQTGLVSVPSDGPVSWTAREDVAEAAARILLADRTFDGPITLTASAAPTFADLAGYASAASGRPVGFEVLGEDEWLDRAVAHGQDPHMAGFLLGMYRAAAQGLFAGTDPLLGEILGREPRPVQDQIS